MSTKLQQLKTRYEEVSDILDEMETEWDNNHRAKYANTPDMGWKAYCEFRKDALKESSELYREIRMIDSFEMNELSEFGDIMSLGEFIGNCKCGGFIDYDGYGYYVKDGKESNICIYPSDIKHGKYRKDFTHVIWFNR